MDPEPQPRHIDGRDVSELLGTLGDLQIEDLPGFMEQFSNLMQEYRAGIREIRTKFEILDEDTQVRLDRNPIHAITTRLKSPASLLEKLQRKGYPVTLESIRANLFDVAGVRVVCNYLSDVEDVAQALLRQDDVRLIERKDYIANPKPSGYRSLHLVVSVPVFLSDRRREVPVEVQLRTIAEDFWASLEHRLRYKNDEVLQARGAEVDDIRARLVESAHLIAAIDQAMERIRTDIDDLADEQERQRARLSAIEQAQAQATLAARAAKARTAAQECREGLRP